MLAMPRHCRELHGALVRPLPEMFVVVCPNLFSPLLNPLSGLELRIEESSKYVGRKIAGAKIYPGILVNFSSEELLAVGTLLPHDLGTIDVSRVIDDQGTAFATDKVLGFVETERSQCPKRAQRPALIRPKQSVGVVLDDGDSMSLRNGTDAVHFAPYAGIVHWHDSPGALCDQLLK
jgi:hypothetical protein